MAVFWHMKRIIPFLRFQRFSCDCHIVFSHFTRSHAVLEIIVKRKQRSKYQNQVMRGKLALVDLAGSERASETKSGGQKLRDGANINRSLLALANCINALGKQQKKGLAYVPYRNSKLTRILKDGLSGNSQTVMVATISPADNQYHHTINTLKYADRAKEIKTHIQKNIGTIYNHVSDYQRMINSLQIEVCHLKKQLADKESLASVKAAEKVADDELSWLDGLSRETSENVQERINLQKALFELEETNLRNRIELQHLDDAIAKQQAIQKEGAVVEALRSRRQIILDNIRDNDEAGINYQQEIEANEKQRCQLQDMIEKAISKDGNRTYLRILSQYRLLGMANTELQFEMAMRDQIIHNQRRAQRNLWNLLMGLGLDEKRLLDLADKQGIMIEDWAMIPHFGLADKQMPNSALGKCSCIGNSSYLGQSFPRSYVFQQFQDLGSGSFSKGPWDPSQAFCNEENHSSDYMLSNDKSPQAYMRLRKSTDHWVNNMTDSWFGRHNKRPPNMRSSCPEFGAWASPLSDCFQSASSFSVDLNHRAKDECSNNSRQPLFESPYCVMRYSREFHKRSTKAHGGSASEGFFGYDQLERGSGLQRSNHNLHNTESTRSPNPSQIPYFTSATQISFVAPSPDSKIYSPNFV